MRGRSAPNTNHVRRNYYLFGALYLEPKLSPSRPAIASFIHKTTSGPGWTQGPGRAENAAHPLDGGDLQQRVHVADQLPGVESDAAGHQAYS